MYEYTDIDGLIMHGKVKDSAAATRARQHIYRCLATTVRNDFASGAGYLGELMDATEGGEGVLSRDEVEAIVLMIADQLEKKGK